MFFSWRKYIYISNFEQTVTPKNDFCRIFSRSKILSPLSEILHRVLDDKPVVDSQSVLDDRPGKSTAKNTLTEQIEGRVVSIFMLFSKAENYVKEVVADRMVLKSMALLTLLLGLLTNF